MTGIAGVVQPRGGSCKRRQCRQENAPRGQRSQVGLAVIGYESIPHQQQQHGGAGNDQCREAEVGGADHAATTLTTAPTASPMTDRNGAGKTPIATARTVSGTRTPDSTGPISTPSPTSGAVPFIAPW